ncbi:MAG TPA: 2-oxoacid:acceptor oxidoreductase family protein [Acidobacteriota bacterium]|nr:2-oxoacid:acceptor oxidoreductase family protein [Acidobacteriota bacterium]
MDNVNHRKHTGEAMDNSIRMSGLGGQGVVTAAHILGSAAVMDGKNSTVNPFFGAEKRLAPAESYVRISTTPIYDVGEIVYPNIIMIFHPDVITLGKSYTMPFFSGVRKDGVIIVNSENRIELSSDDKGEIERLNIKLYFIDATETARTTGKTELSANVAMLGALVGLTGVVTVESLHEALKERFGGKVKLVASGTTAALDDAIKRQFDKVEKLIAANIAVFDVALKNASALKV